MSSEPGFRRSIPQRNPVRISQGDLVRKGCLSARELPLLVEPAGPQLDLTSWARSNRAEVEADLDRYGAILFRGFSLAGASSFEGFIGAISEGTLEYLERSSPRSRVSGRIYTSTEHPADQTIFLHNEQSYNLVVPGKVVFYCVRQAETGGATPIADCRRVLERIDPTLRRRLDKRKYRYVRNFGSSFGLPWQEAFQTESKAAVEDYCRDGSIGLEWRDGERLRTWQIRPVMARHPRSGDVSWCNHLTFFHLTTLEASVREALLSGFGEADLPHNTYYGDGSPIEEDLLEELRSAYRAETVEFEWREGDVLLLDNMMVAHGRAPYSGPRKVVVGMAEPRRWPDVELDSRSI